MRNSPPFREAVAEWYAKVSVDPLGQPKFSDSEIQRRTGVARTTLNRLRDMDGDTDEKKLAKLADLFGVDRPTVVKALQVEQGALQVPRKALGWVVEAQRALEHAAGLLRGKATEPPPDDDDAIGAVHRRTKGGGSGGGGGRRKKTAS